MKKSKMGLNLSQAFSTDFLTRKIRKWNTSANLPTPLKLGKVGKQMTPNAAKRKHCCFGGDAEIQQNSLN